MNDTGNNNRLDVIMNEYNNIISALQDTKDSINKNVDDKIDGLRKEMIMTIDKLDKKIDSASEESRKHENSLTETRTELRMLLNEHGNCKSIIQNLEIENRGNKTVIANLVERVATLEKRKQINVLVEIGKYAGILGVIIATVKLMK